MRKLALLASGTTLFVQLILLLIFTPAFLYAVASIFNGSLSTVAVVLAYGVVVCLWIKLIQRYLDQ